MEVYTGAKPGRPAVAAMTCGVALLAALGLAWVQIRQARGLGDEIRIAETPLVVRIPQNWAAAPGEPGVFELRGRERNARGRPAVHRRIVIRYERLATFRAPHELAAELYRVRPEAVSPSSVGIGPLPAIDVRVRERFERFGALFERYRLSRLACSPRGDLILIEYHPLTELTLADIQLLDDISASVRIDDPAFSKSPESALAAAGLSLPADTEWRVYGPDFDGVPGVFLAKRGDDALRWTIGVHRTWLAPQRDSAALLRDFAATHWELDGEPPHMEQSTTGGRTMAAVRHPRFGIDAPPNPSAWLVATDAGEAAMLLVFAERAAATAADGAAAQLAASMELRRPAAWFDSQKARRAAAELVSTLTSRGPAPWWGRLEHVMNYVAEWGTVKAQGSISRRATDRDPSRGYSGRSEFILAETRASRSLVWSVDGVGLGYELTFQTQTLHGSRLRRSVVQEQRRRGANRVIRTIVEGARTSETVFETGDNFVAPPLETIAESWVAQRTDGHWLFQGSLLEGEGAYTRLLRPLGPDAEGNTRVLAMDDYYPRGSVLAYDADGELAYEVTPFGRIQRRR